MSCFFKNLATDHNDEICCETNPEDDNYDSCLEGPGQAEDLNIYVNLNSVTIDWTQPCGISTHWYYYLVNSMDDTGGASIPSPYTIEDLELIVNSFTKKFFPSNKLT